MDEGRNRKNEPTHRPDKNPDPITGAPGAHPVGTGLGAAAGGAAGVGGAAAAGAALGTVVGPAGTIAGAAIGAIAGGLAGKGIAEAVNPTETETQTPPAQRAETLHERQTAVPDRTAHATSEQATIQLSEEKLKVGKREVEVGGVRLHKIVSTEVVNQPIELKREELVIERVPAKDAHAGKQQAFNEQEVTIPLRREEAVVEKEVRLREEVHVRMETQTDRQEVEGEVRREDIQIEETGEARGRGTGPGAKGAAGDIREHEEQPRSMRRRE